MKALEKPNLAVDVEVLICSHFISTEIFKDKKDNLHLCKHCREFFTIDPNGKKVIVRSFPYGQHHETKPLP